MNTAIDHYSHPIFDDVNFMIHTKALENFHERLHRWLWQGSTGAVVLGDARVGKSTALTWIRSEIYLRNKEKVPTHVVSCKRRDTKTIRSTYVNLCISADLYFTKRDQSDVLMRLFVGFLVDLTAKGHSNNIILFVDEMQRLSKEQMDVFAELYDELKDRYKIQLMVVFVGNRQDSTPLIRSFQDRSKAHLSGRFMNQVMLFEGLVDESAVKYCLNQYDTLRHPFDGPTYTEFFLPEDFQASWRLASLSPLLWRCYKAYAKEHEIPSWGMTYFTNTITLLLSELLPAYGVNAVNEELINTAIDESNMIPSRVDFDFGL